MSCSLPWRLRWRECAGRFTSHQVGRGCGSILAASIIHAGSSWWMVVGGWRDASMISELHTSPYDRRLALPGPLLPAAATVFPPQTGAGTRTSPTRRIPPKVRKPLILVVSQGLVGQPLGHHPTAAAGSLDSHRNWSIEISCVMEVVVLAVCADARLHGKPKA